MIGVMFHHFHGKSHNSTQGSISNKEFEKIILFLKKKKKIINPQKFRDLVINKNFKGNEVCLTFDDAIKSQIDVALPILDKYKIKAFFFIYSGIFKNSYDNLEYFRDFRCQYYKNINLFYREFFQILERYYPKKNLEFEKKFPKQYLKKYIFYSRNDRKFRFCRDKILTKKQYENLMLKLMKHKKYNKNQRKKYLFMNKKDILNLIKKNHTIGLHSESHPTDITKLSYSSQFKEYLNCKNLLEKITKKKIWSMSHPCGKYDNQTLKALKKIGIEIGFKSNLFSKTIKSNFEIPREDHINLINLVK